MLTHPFNNDGAKERLLQDYHRHRGLVVGVDFDNTVYDTHDSGKDFSAVINILKRAQEIGCVICLYTAECNANRLAWKYNWLVDQGVQVKYINQSPLLKGTIKPFFNILLDDRAGLESACETLLYVIRHAELPSKN